MPNWVKNIVTFEGEQNEIERLLDFIKRDKDKNADENEYGRGTIDFNKVIPMPKSLHIPESSQTSNAIDIYLTAINPETKDFGVKKTSKNHLQHIINILPVKYFGGYKTALTEEEVEKITSNSYNGSFKELFALGKKAITNLKKYGALTWYGWCLANWNTKWNACDSITTDSNTIEFNTAWSAPRNVIERVSTMFPTTNITHKWADEDIGNNCGVRYYANGMIEDSRHYSVDNDGDTAVEFANSVWGWGD